ncbi:anhydro-N-acetylmuramic acid kinase [Arsenicibacter rosenii]|uniref:Anhydro-N-acetylmuramic acid kinase n=1 Tax=Arsenicibacter rosenii TaxID=1750698 RepID=A0A1S2VGV1_9BACT|nr:anhydro-N-acetylmuramic acid kinase [Arsenicibacter rosenii]OIN57949.1 anhydro-N-acetylmuramic acid kinase [Arsenicibacter rosenii]
MNKQVQRLYEIAGRSERRIIGLMSGTSLDGLDIALCRIQGSGPETEVEVTHFDTIPYTDDIKAEIRKVFAKKEIDFQHLCLLNPWIGRLHGQMVLNCLERWNISPDRIDLIASHGQTVFHAPKALHQQDKFPNATLQIGDGDHVAVTTGIITLSDFRQKHTAMGGEGAPLAVYGDYFVFSEPAENRILLNMGGIANFTYLPATQDATEVFTTDTGPGNTLLDAFARRFSDKPYDEDGRMAASGKVNTELLKALKKSSFFDQPFPKTTGPELFSLDYVRQAQQRSSTTSLSPEDLMATLTRFSAETIAETVLQVIQPELTYHVYMSGGGMHNPVLTGAIRDLLPNCIFGRTDDIGISGDAKEAVLFAVLANEAVAGGQTLFERDDKKRAGVPSITMGKISFPR